VEFFTALPQCSDGANWAVMLLQRGPEYRSPSSRSWEAVAIRAEETVTLDAWHEAII
jgi:hypothetical protein